MASVHGMNAAVLYGSVNLTTYFNSMEVSAEVDTAETTTFGTGIVKKTYVPGPVDATLSLEGVWDGAAAGVDATLSALLGTGTNVVSAAWQGFATRGNRAAMLSGIDTKYDVTASVSDAVMVKAEMQGSGQHALGGTILRELIDRTATSAGAAANSYDTGTTSSTGYVAALHTTVATADDTPSLAVKLVDSADNSTFADVTGAVFTTQNAAGAQLIASTTQTVQRYVAATLTIGGTNPHLTSAVVFAKL